MPVLCRIVVVISLAVFWFGDVYAQTPSTPPAAAKKSVRPASGAKRAGTAKNSGVAKKQPRNRSGTERATGTKAKAMAESAAAKKEAAIEEKKTNDEISTLRAELEKFISEYQAKISGLEASLGTSSDSATSINSRVGTLENRIGQAPAGQTGTLESRLTSIRNTQSTMEGQIADLMERTKPKDVATWDYESENCDALRTMTCSQICEDATLEAMDLRGKPTLAFAEHFNRISLRDKPATLADNDPRRHYLWIASGFRSALESLLTPGKFSDCIRKCEETRNVRKHVCFNESAISGTCARQLNTRREYDPTNFKDGASDANVAACVGYFKAGVGYGTAVGRAGGIWPVRIMTGAWVVKNNLEPGAEYTCAASTFGNAAPTDYTHEGQTRRANTDCFDFNGALLATSGQKFIAPVVGGVLYGYGWSSEEKRGGERIICRVGTNANEIQTSPFINITGITSVCMPLYGEYAIGVPVPLTRSTSNNAQITALSTMILSKGKGPGIY